MDRDQEYMLQLPLVDMFTFFFPLFAWEPQCQALQLPYTLPGTVVTYTEMLSTGI